MKKKYIGIIDAKFGNLASVINAVKYLGHNYNLLNKPTKIESYSHFILPGVGSYNKAAKKLNSLGWYQAIKDLTDASTPLLGICLGMQLMFEEGEENGKIKGLRLFKGKCKLFSKNNKLALPHMGFNLVNHNKSKIWNNIPNPSPFYFLHSYRIKDVEDDALISKTNYGENFISFIEKKKIFGAQFHPEKSHKLGLKLINNFIEKI
jgi:glutamine amidotransferase|tara:strand:+ start:148 stop:765 length:618 start_codon:yes stop_codon:yes gene_type:complete